MTDRITLAGTGDGMIGLTFCSVDGCEDRARFRGWCRKHYNRWQRHGDPIAGRTPNGVPIAWLRDAVANAGNSCVEWPFNRDRDGYGRVRFDGRFQRVGHVALTLSGAPRTSHNHMALHEPQACHNPACINPKHLRWGLPKENTADRLIDGTAAIRERNPAAKLTTDDVSRIREDNRVHRLIARDYGVSRSQISRIKKGVAW